MTTGAHRVPGARVGATTEHDHAHHVGPAHDFEATVGPVRNVPDARRRRRIGAPPWFAFLVAA